MLWIALHLPSLSLESFAATLPTGIDARIATDEVAKATTVEASSTPNKPPTSSADALPRPLALVDAQRIASANGAARALGVKPGLKRATALALAPQIMLGQADAKRDAEALRAVAHAALAFTPHVVLPRLDHPADSPFTVLLEVEPSLRYFGGLAALKERLLQTLEPLGHDVHGVSAPTAQGAALLARRHRHFEAADLAAARCALDALPVWLLGPGREHWEALQGMGLRTLADLRSLPRAGIARRFSEGMLVELDAAFGLRPDPREPLVPADAFESRLELFARADSSEQLLYGAEVLLARLVAWLAGQHAFARRFTLVMQHEKRWRQRDETPAETTLDVALAEPSRDAAHLLVLLRERLTRLQLPAPTLELRLHAADVVQRGAPNHELFPTPKSEGEGITRLIERLQARLGPSQVQRLQAVDDHRPERASIVIDADAAGVASRGKTGGRAGARASGTKVALAWASTSSAASGSASSASSASTSTSTSSAKRPVWLWPEAEPLAERHFSPLLDGAPLQLLSGPERIEAGWWDAGLAERDYFIAQASDGALVWIYRMRLPMADTPEGGVGQPGWFLQGRFG